VLLLRSDRDNPRPQAALRDHARAAIARGIPHKTLRSRAEHAVEVLQMVYFTDYVSFYVALLNGADPSPVKSIAYLRIVSRKGLSDERLRGRGPC